MQYAIIQWIIISDELTSGGRSWGGMLIIPVCTVNSILFQYIRVPSQINSVFYMKKVSVNPSLIPGSGMGLFADEYIKRGELIVEVTGQRYKGDSDAVPENNLYLLDSGDGTNDYIDVQGPARYANDACGLTRMPGLVNNSLFRLLDDGSMWLEATKTIRPGQEIFASYGRAYWSAVRLLMQEAAALSPALQPA